jgi:hypothetical protein
MTLSRILMFNPTRELSGEELTRLMEEWGQLINMDLFNNFASVSEERKVTSNRLLQQATTFKQRTFARMFRYLNTTSKQGVVKIAFSNGERVEVFVVETEDYTVATLLTESYKLKEIRDFLSKAKLIDPPMNINADVEISHLLQELADAVAQEGTNAFKESYYPGIPNVDVPDKHVRKVMVAMQRELDREAARVGKRPAVFVELPIERQRALAERRRWWFAKFGITPASWRTGKFSLWKISDEEIAEYTAWIYFNN